MTDQVLDGFWKWYPSETAVEFKDWGHDQPNNGVSSNCGAIWESFGYHWVDEPCTGRNFNPICEIP